MQTPAAPALPLIVRLRNWVGDVVLSLPTLQRLAAAGHDLRLVGKGWARDLLAGHGWPVHALPKPLGERVRLLRSLRTQALGDDPGFSRRAVNAVAFPYSFSSALDMRLAGLRAIGHAREARGWLLARSEPRPDRHELEVYWHLGSALLGTDAPLPDRIDLAVSPDHADAAEALLRQHALPASGYIAICPFAGGTFAGQDKTWPGFAAYAAEELRRTGRAIVICPGPGEEALSAAAFPGCTQLPGVNLGVYAGLLKRAAVMVSNDTGPGHLAAAVGTPLVSVLGPSDPAQWRAWGPQVHLVQGVGGWPARDAVHDAVRGVLGG